MNFGLKEVRYKVLSFGFSLLGEIKTKFLFKFWRQLIKENMRRCDFPIEDCYSCKKRINEMQQDHCNQEETPKPALLSHHLLKLKTFHAPKAKMTLVDKCWLMALITYVKDNDYEKFRQVIFSVNKNIRATRDFPKKNTHPPKDKAKKCAEYYFNWKKRERKHNLLRYYPLHHRFIHERSTKIWANFSLYQLLITHQSRRH